MRVGVDISKALPPRDGIGRFTAELVRALTAAGAAPRLYALGPAADRARVDACFPGAEVGVDPACDGLDVFHATAWTVPAHYRGPLVFTCYDLTFLSHPDCHTFDNKVRCLTGLLEARLAGAAIAAVSHATARELEARLGVGAAEVRVVHPAAASAFRPLAAGQARRRVAERFGVDGPYVLAVGTREPRKNLRRLAAAWSGLPAELRRRHPLLAAGAEGWMLADGELDGVRRLGFVAEDDLVALYGAASVFAYPSLAEGFGLPVLEAMACGAPVLTSDVSSLPEVAGGAARLVDPLDVDALRDALRGLLEDPDERERLRGLGLRRAADLSWAATARRMLELYREVARLPPGP
ncbi:MAG TPA: glycosyltransferase family 1 protein [Thermoanaerobaculia bacterium]